VKGEIYTPDESGTAISEAERTARLLTRAADWLDGLAGAATSRAPWSAGESFGTPAVLAGNWVVATCSPSRLWRGDDDAAWIAAMSPAVAAPLVAWLRSWVPVAPRLAPGTPWLEVNLDAAVEFARLVLGEAATPSVEVATSEEATA
jgi:hypothetical protein